MLVLALAAYQFRRGFIRAWFADAPADAPAPAPDGGTAADAMPPAPPGPVDRVRVVLIDGLSKDLAATLPHLGALCRDGLDLTVDTGFPTVSLPVQHALWTGLTQQQSGILFRGKREITETPLPPPAHGIPAQVPGSLAVAESHQYIVHALGFAEVLPPSPTELPDGWTGEVAAKDGEPGAAGDSGFLQAARAAVASDRRLVFVHILRVDVAGHRAGHDAAAYHQAAARADAMLGSLVAAEHATGHVDDRAPGHAAKARRTQWLVLSDHGHRGGALYGPAGGHGGAEPHIRQVQGCLAGAGLPADGGARGGYVHLIDLGRSLADALGVPLAAAAAGRPMTQALRTRVHPEATLPRPSGARWLAAGLLLLAAMAASVLALRCQRRGAQRGSGGLWRLPWWWPAALASVILIAGMPSLSVPMVYRPLGRVIYVSALPGLAVLAVSAALALRGQPAVRMVLAQLAVPVAALLAAVILAGGAHGLTAGLAHGFAPELAHGLHSPGMPPLMPRWSAMASVLAVLVYAGSGVCALALAVAALRAPRPGPASR